MFAQNQESFLQKGLDFRLWKTPIIHKMSTLDKSLHL